MVGNELSYKERKKIKQELLSPSLRNPEQQSITEQVCQGCHWASSSKLPVEALL
jgi:hypothetical protein